MCSRMRESTHDEVHRFLLTHRVNERPEGVQRTNTHDDVHDGMVVEWSSRRWRLFRQVVCHFPHLPHVLVVNQLVEFWDKFGGEEGSVWQCGILNTSSTTRFGPDVVLSTLTYHTVGNGCCDHLCLDVRLFLSAVCLSGLFTSYEFIMTHWSLSLTCYLITYLSFSILIQIKKNLKERKKT